MRKLITLLSLILMATAILAIPQVYPNIVESELRDGPVYEEIRITNMGTTYKKYELSIEKDSERYDLSNYIDFFPRVMDIPPKTQKSVRIVIRDLPYDHLEDGELRALLKINEIDSNLSSLYKSRGEKDEFGARVEMKFSVAMMIYGRKGEMIPKIDLSRKEGGSKVTIRNSGNHSFKPRAVYRRDGNEIDIEIPKILRGGERNIELESLGGEFLVYDEGDNSLAKMNIK